MSQSTEHIPHFVIVTPSYNLDAFIEQTIHSVMTQAGDFTIHYHIQDGGSKDQTQAILEKWKTWVSNGTFPVFCRRVTFDYTIEKDTGMYHAINLGFRHARERDRDCIMTWINADDLLPPGALAAVASFFQYEPEAQFVGGRTTLMSDVGFLAGVYAPQPRLRADIFDGFYHGAKNGFIQQEGIFWKSALWDLVGGLDDTLRLAGDFDLWRKLASHAEYFCIDTITGIHRKRKGQLSGNTKAYDDEVAAVLAVPAAKKALPQKCVGHYLYDMEIHSWKPFEEVSDRVLERFSIRTLDDAICFARLTYREARACKSPPWIFTRRGWAARKLRNRLLAAKKELYEQLKAKLHG